MKRLGNLYEKVYDMDNLRLAHEKARLGKGWYKEVKMVNENPDHYLKLLQNMLKNKTYKTSPYETYLKNDHGKEREIFKLPYFPDRICQWAIMLVIEPVLIRNFTKDTYSAIPGRGTHLCLSRMKEAIKKDPQGTKYCLKMDVSKYYPSIKHDILKQKYRRKFKDPNLLWLLDEIIDSTEGNKGIPIGNYLSQYSGNFYLSQFDHWIKEVKQVKYYYRYMDDMVILSDNKDELHRLHIEISAILENKLGLKVKDNWQVFPTFARGVDFIGYRTFEDYVLLRKSIATDYKRKMSRILRKIEAGQLMTEHDWASFNSYKGWLKHCDSRRLYQKYSAPLQVHSDYYYTHYIKGGVA